MESLVYSWQVDAISVRLENMDCMKGMSGMDSGSVDMTLTDIPYSEVDMESSGLRLLDRGDADTLTFDLDRFVSETVRVSRGSVYVFCGWLQVSPLLALYKQHGLSVRACVWSKTNPSPMNGTRLWLSGVEMCVFARKSKATFNEHCVSPVWTYPSGSSKVHPTEKPSILFDRLIEASSNVGDTVFDPCSGSGTTASSCVRLGRSFTGYELSPEYYGTSCVRINREVRKRESIERVKANVSTFFDMS